LADLQILRSEIDMGIRHEILKTLRKERKLTQDEVAQIIGVSRTSYLKYEKGTHEPDFETLKKLAYLFDVDCNELIGTSGKSIKKIPILGCVQAGMPTDACECIEGYEEIPGELAETGTYIALRVKGDSMSPRILPGDIVIVRVQQDVESGDTAVVIVDDGEATVKKILKYPDGVRLVPNNPAYEPLFFTNNEIISRPVTIFGKVAELRRKF
jgi:repressor LexA